MHCGSTNNVSCVCAKATHSLPSRAPVYCGCPGVSRCPGWHRNRASTLVCGVGLVLLLTDCCVGVSVHMEHRHSRRGVGRLSDPRGDNVSECSFVVHASTSLVLAMFKLVFELSSCKSTLHRIVVILQDIHGLDLHPVHLVLISVLLYLLSCLISFRLLSQPLFSFVMVFTVTDLGGVFHLRTVGRSNDDLSLDACSSPCTFAVLLPSTCSSCLLGLRPSFVYAARCLTSRLVHTLLVRTPLLLLTFQFFRRVHVLFVRLFNLPSVHVSCTVAS